MTVTDILGHRPDGWWTFDDLKQLPDDGMRYELADGCLLVSPAPSPRHGEVLARLRRVLDRQAPTDLAVSNDVGVQMGSTYSYLVPDLFVIPWTGFRSHPKYLMPADVRLAVEILSEHNRGRDLVLKRHYYSAVGIPRYWIIDPFNRTLTVLVLGEHGYDEETVVAAGKTFATDEPFPLVIDRADVCDCGGDPD